MTEPIDPAVFTAAAHDLARLSAQFRGLMSIGPELAKIASIEGAVKESKARHEAALAEEDATKTRIADEIAAMRATAEADAQAALADTQREAQAIRDRGNADAATIIANAHERARDVDATIAAKHKAADDEIAARHRAAANEIADNHANALATLDREIKAKTLEIAVLDAGIDKLLNAPLAERARKLLSE